MFIAYVIVTVLAIAANAFSGVAAILHFKPILPGMARAGVPARRGPGVQPALTCD